MSKTLVVGTEEFEVPLEGESGNYGESLTDFFTAIADALTTVQARNDIPATSAAILNNVTNTAIPGFSFDTSEVISINCEFIVRRTTDAPAVNLVSDGEIRGNFDGSTWSISIVTRGFSGVSFDINNSGQVIYNSSNLTGSNYQGSIIFKGRVFNQPE